ncbi:MAG: hypothetical protein KJT03_16440, partial [Verrucomicrobiae bacterium]|nr:hypothetical protein [Verrucomicrobiae bacterium]
MNRPCYRLMGVVFVLVNSIAFAIEGDLKDLGLLDVTQAPYFADPSGVNDSTEALQRAVNNARDQDMVCFFPSGTYLISDTLSCEQEVKKLDRPRFTDRDRQSWWNKDQTLLLLGSTRGTRPVLKLTPEARGFDDPEKPKYAVYIWAQTRNDAPGKTEPEWGKEQPNISFNHLFKGIDIDIRGHTGAIGIRHSGSQGSTLQDSTILAEDAFAGMSNCPGQGGGTYNIEVRGGRYGILLDRDSRFPILVSCQFNGQTEANVRYGKSGGQMPSLWTGCVFEPAGKTVFEFTPNTSIAGISLVDCMVETPRGGLLVQSEKRANVYVENTWMRGLRTIQTSGDVSVPPNWSRIIRYSVHNEGGRHMINGSIVKDEILELAKKPEVPDKTTLLKKHYRPGPSFEDPGVVHVRDFGAGGDGKTDDTAAFQKAINSAEKIYISPGRYALTGILKLKKNTQLIGLSRAVTRIGDLASRGGPSAGSGGQATFVLSTPDAVDAAPGLWFLAVGGEVDWRSSQGTSMLTSGRFALSGHGGGKLYGVMAMGRPLTLKHIKTPTAFYALNVERVVSNPQSLIENSSHIRIYFFKVEAGSISRENAGDGNTPCMINDSNDIR